MIHKTYTKCVIQALTATLLFAATSVAHSTTRDDFPTCYNLLGESELASAPDQRELFAVIDQTVIFNTDLKRHVHNKVHEFLKPGDRITVLTFSAYAEGRYATMPLTGKLDVDLTEDQRYNTGSSKLRKFDKCMERQKVFVRAKVDKTMKQAFEDASTNLPKTELMGSLVNFSNGIISNSRASEKVILLVSDMMENSDAVSFYRGGGVQNLNVEGTLDATHKAELFSQFDGANVHVIGAGISDSGGYLSQKTMQKMKSFWEGYVAQSGGNLIGWGQPELFSPLR